MTMKKAFCSNFFRVFRHNKYLSVRLGHTFQFVLFLDSVAVGASLGRVDELISQALGDGFDVPEGSLACSGAQEPDGLVDTSQR